MKADNQTDERRQETRWIFRIEHNWPLYASILVKLPGGGRIGLVERLDSKAGAVVFRELRLGGKHGPQDCRDAREVEFCAEDRPLSRCVLAHVFPAFAGELRRRDVRDARRAGVVNRRTALVPFCGMPNAECGMPNEAGGPQLSTFNPQPVGGEA